MDSPSAFAVLLLAAGPTTSAGPPVSDLAAEIGRNRTILMALPASTFVDGQRSGIVSQLDAADASLKAQQVSTVLELLSSAAPGVSGMARGATGWDDTGKGAGKGIDALSKEWEAVGEALKADRPKFPSARPRSQSLFVRGLAEQSMGQIDEYYSVTVDYGRFSGAAFGAYYLGRAEGHLRFALFLSRIEETSVRPAKVITSLAAPLARLDDEIVTAYARPGSTAQHSNFIIANSSMKLARELERKGFHDGALVTMLRSLFALSLATMAAPPEGENATLSTRLDELEKGFLASKHDRSVGFAFVEKARIALEKSKAGGEGADRERLRAAAIAVAVLPRYLELMEGFEK